MYCNKCGKQLSDDVCFCNDCGAQLNVPQMQVQPATLKKPFVKMMAIVMAVLAVVAVVIFGAIRILSEKNTPEAVVERLGVAIEEADYDKFMACFHEEWLPLLCETYGADAFEAEEYMEEYIASKLLYLSEELVKLEVIESHSVASDEAEAILQDMASIGIDMASVGIYVTDMQYVSYSVVWTTDAPEVDEFLMLEVDGAWYLSPEYLLEI